MRNLGKTKTILIIGFFILVMCVPVFEVSAEQLYYTRVRLKYIYAHNDHDDLDSTGEFRLQVKFKIDGTWTDVINGDTHSLSSGTFWSGTETVTAGEFYVDSNDVVAVRLQEQGQSFLWFHDATDQIINWQEQIIPIGMINKWYYEMPATQEGCRMKVEIYCWPI